MKPDWEDAPEWANYLAMDEDGFWFWYESKPDPRQGSWRQTGKALLAARPEVDYLSSLERRP